MNKIVKLTIIAIVISVSISMLSTSLFSDGHNAPAGASKKVKKIGSLKKSEGDTTMLFHVTHVHSYQTCPSHDPDVKASVAEAFKTAADKGVKLLMATVDAPGHNLYMLLEANSYEAIMNFFEPLLEIGDADIRPVTDVMAAMNIAQDWDEKE